MIFILAIGQRQPAWVNDALADYLGRFPESQRPRLKEIKVEPRTTGKPVAALLQAEAERLRAGIPKDAITIALDEHGKAVTTLEFAALIEKFEQTATHLVFLIGGPDGLDPKLKVESHQTLRLSSMTLPHGIARVLLTEQLYRARSLLNKHPYHRA
jgi:23S rRNA (pseudouridine1915-N3)-methyltransferase